MPNIDSGIKHLKRKDNGEFDSISIYLDSENNPYLTIYPNGKGADNLTYLSEESYKMIEASLPLEYQGKVHNPDQ